MKLVRYSCGCVGFEPDDHPEGVLLISACDDDSTDNEFGLFRRTAMPTDRAYEEVGVLGANEYVRQLSALIRDGYEYRELRTAMGISELTYRVKELEAQVEAWQQKGCGS